MTFCTKCGGTTFLETCVVCDVSPESITIDDVQCIVSAIRLLTEEGFNDATILPKKRLAVKLYSMAGDKSFDHKLPKWVKSGRIDK